MDDTKGGINKYDEMFHGRKSVRIMKKTRNNDGVPEMARDFFDPESAEYSPVHESIAWDDIFSMNIVNFEVSLMRNEISRAFDILNLLQAKLSPYVRGSDDYSIKVKTLRKNYEQRAKTMHPNKREAGEFGLLKGLLMERYELVLSRMKKLGLMPKTSAAD